MLAKYILLLVLNPITIMWILAIFMQIFNISMNDHTWYAFPLLMTNTGLLMLSIIFTFKLLKILQKDLL